MKAHVTSKRRSTVRVSLRPDVAANLRRVAVEQDMTTDECANWLMYSTQIVSIFEQIKKLLDPKFIMNPGKKVIRSDL